MTENAGINVTW